MRAARPHPRALKPSLPLACCRQLHPENRNRLDQRDEDLYLQVSLNQLLADAIEDCFVIKAVSVLFDRHDEQLKRAHLLVLERTHALTEKLAQWTTERKRKFFLLRIHLKFRNVD